MKLFRKKNKRSVEEQNKHNEETWAKNDLVVEEYKKMTKKAVELLKESGVDEEFIKQFLLNHANEGKNISEDGTEYWVCAHCGNLIKFDTREDYITHHFKEHS